MKQQMIKKSKGVVLIESLIALAVFTVGMLGLSNYQGDTLREGGQQKARDEATLLAQDKLEQIRNFDRAGFETVTATEQCESITGVNADFNRCWVSVSEILTGKLITITVDWTGADGEVDGVSLSALLVWKDVAKESLVAEKEDTFTPLPLPGGDSTTAPEDVELIAEEDVDESFDVDGDLEILVDEDAGDDGISQLVDGDDNVLLQADNPLGFVQLRGYLKWLSDDITDLDTPLEDSFFQLNTDLDPARITFKALTSDYSYCEAESSTPVSTSSTTPDLLDGYFFHCYVSANWYGNLGIVGFNSRDELCPPRYSYLPVIGDGDYPLTVVPGSGSLLRTVDNQNFALVNLRGNDTCDSVSLPDYEVTHPPVLHVSGFITLDSSVVEAEIGDTQVIATADNDCQIDSEAATTLGLYSYRCSIPTDGNGWDGHIVVIPGDGLEVCGENVYYFPPDALPITENVEVEQIFTIDEDQTLTNCDADGYDLPEYEFTVTFIATAVNDTADPAGIIFDTTSDDGGDDYIRGVVLDEAGENPSYRVTVIAPLGTEVTISYSHATDTLSSSSDGIRLPPTVSEAGDFQLTGTTIEVAGPTTP